MDRGPETVLCPKCRSSSKRVSVIERAWVWEVESER